MALDRKEIDIVAPLAGSVDRNRFWCAHTHTPKSLPSRGAWIEIVSSLVLTILLRVAPLAGSVDRNNDVVNDFKTYVGRSPRGERG